MTQKTGKKPHAAAQQEQKKDWEKRALDRAELAKRAGAHVVLPTSGVTRIVLQIAQQLDVNYQQLTQKSGYFGTISNEKRMEIERQLAEHLIGLSLTGERMAKTVGGRYWHPRELAPYIEKQTPAERTARKAKPAASPAAPVPAPAGKAEVPVRIGKKNATAETEAPVAEAPADPVAATA